jgi:hypothetical protein
MAKLDPPYRGRGASTGEDLGARMGIFGCAAVESSILMNRRTTWSDEIFGPLVKSDRWRLCIRRDRLGYGLICTYQDILIVSGDNEGGT